MADSEFVDRYDAEEFVDDVVIFDFIRKEGVSAESLSF